MRDNYGYFLGKSAELAQDYRTLQTRLRAQGKLRAAPAALPASLAQDDILAMFSRIAFNDQDAATLGLSINTRTRGLVKRWDSPIRAQITFGASVPAYRATRDRAEISDYLADLDRLLPLSITQSDKDPNFHILVMSDADRAELMRRVRPLLHASNDAILRLFANPPKNVQCFVIVLSHPLKPARYQRAIALLRDEHPKYLRSACVQEEIAQGLGLTNDDPTVNPSIFNDNDAYTNLTALDRLMLQMLYSPQLRTGEPGDSALQKLKAALTTRAAIVPEK